MCRRRRGSRDVQHQQAFSSGLLPDPAARPDQPPDRGQHLLRLTPMDRLIGLLARLKPIQLLGRLRPGIRSCPNPLRFAVPEHRFGAVEVVALTQPGAQDLRQRRSLHRRDVTPFVHQSPAAGPARLPSLVEEGQPNLRVPLPQHPLPFPVYLDEQLPGPTPATAIPLVSNTSCCTSLVVPGTGPPASPTRPGHRCRPLHPRPPARWAPGGHDETSALFD